MVAPSSKENDLICWPWTAIVVNIVKEAESEKDVENTEYWMKRFSKYKPEVVEILWDDQKQKAQALVRFNNDWIGFKNAMEFEKVFEADHHSKKEWVAAENPSSSSIYAWLARSNDYESQGPIGDYLRTKRELKNINDLVHEAVKTRYKAVVELATEIDMRNENLDDLYIKYTQKYMSLSRMLEENDGLHQAFYEEKRKMQHLYPISEVPISPYQMEYSSGEENDLICWAWTAIVVNIVKEAESEKDVENTEYWMKRFSEYKPQVVEILWDDEEQKAQALVVRFNDDWIGFKNAMEFENAFEADHHSKKEWIAAENPSSIYAWLARSNDFESQGPIGDYLRTKRELKTVNDLVHKSIKTRNKALVELATNIAMTRKNLDDLRIKFNQTNMSFSRMLEEKVGLQAFYEGMLKWLGGSMNNLKNRIQLSRQRGVCNEGDGNMHGNKNHGEQVVIQIDEK